MTFEYQNYLAHFGIKGQKWGIRRFQNEDGTLTEAGRIRYQKQLDRDIKKKWWKVNNNVAERSAGEFAKINDKYKNVDTSDNNPKMKLAYLKEMADVDDRLYREEAAKFFKDNPAYTDEQVSKIPTYGQIRRKYTEEADRLVGRDFQKTKEGERLNKKVMTLVQKLEDEYDQIREDDIFGVDNDGSRYKAAEKALAEAEEEYNKAMLQFAAKKYH